MTLSQDGSSQDAINAYLEFIQRPWRKKDELLAATHRIIDLSVSATPPDNPRIIADIKKEINTVLSCLSELQPHTKATSLLAALSSQSFLLMTLCDGSSNDEFKWSWLKRDLGIFCQAANQIPIKPTRRSVEKAFGIKIGGAWAKLEASVKEQTGT